VSLQKPHRYFFIQLENFKRLISDYIEEIKMSRLSASLYEFE